MVIDTKPAEISDHNSNESEKSKEMKNEEEKETEEVKKENEEKEEEAEDKNDDTEAECDKTTDTVKSEETDAEDGVGHEGGGDGKLKYSFFYLFILSDLFIIIITLKA